MLRKIVRQTCQRCHSEFCFACGEPISGEKVKRPSAAQDDDPLFHCSNLQGVILGVGLSMLEQLFDEQRQEPQDTKDQGSRTNKRRKTTMTPSHDLDDQDSAYYSGVPGKKAKGGIGYAGDVKEDVSAQTSHTQRRLTSSVEFWANGSASCTTSQR